MKNIIKTAFFFLILVLSSTTLFAATQVTAFRASNSANKSRLVFESTDPVKYILFTLTKPNRLVLDLKDAQLAVKLKKSALKKTVIKNFRVSPHKNGYLRIVMDLKQTITAKSFVLNPSKTLHTYRLVIDLTSGAAINNHAVTAVNPGLKSSPTKTIVSAPATITPVTSKPIVAVAA